VLVLSGPNWACRWGRRLLRIGVVAIAALMLASLLGTVPARADDRPATSTSYYIKSARTPPLNATGCSFARGVNAGSQPKDALVVMAFGRPRQKYRRYGVSLFSRRGFATTAKVRGAGVAFVTGFRRCVKDKQGSNLRVVLGTSNYGDQVSYAHGRAWADMVNAANEEMAERGWQDQIDLVGGSDIELFWNGPKTTKAWVHGYDSANVWPYYDFGDAALCPPYGRCAGAWTMEDVWYVAWGAPPAIPLPEIYTGNGSSAKQWYNVSLYSQREHSSRMAFAGVMSQRRACDQSRDPCRGMNNGPRRAWRQLTWLLNSRPETAQRLRWSTDIAWHRR
jgi:hypothetical protein